MGGASDGNFTAGIGVPTLDGLGAVGGGAHADDEHILLAELLPRTALLAALVQDVLASDRRTSGGQYRGRPGRCWRRRPRRAATTADRAGVDIRPLETLEQMTAACAVLEQVWGVEPGAVFDVQPHLLRALGHGGNYLVGAYPLGSGELVGASSAFFTEPLGAAMHSHITGVLPGTAGRGVGGGAEVASAAVGAGARTQPDHLDLRPVDRPQLLLQPDPAGRPAGDLLRRLLRRDE